MQLEEQNQTPAAREIPPQADSTESIPPKQRGGKRPGAGRKPNLSKVLLKGVSRTTILAAVENIDVGVVIIGLLKSKREQTRLEAIGEYRNKQLLESALGRPFQWAGGQDAFPTIVGKAAALFHSLIANHPFHNGNKRTAVLRVDAFLMGNGYSMALDNDRMYELAQITGRYRQDGISHDDQLARITDELGEFSVEVDLLRSAKISDKEMRKKLSNFYQKQIMIARSIRRDQRNTLIDP